MNPFGAYVLGMSSTADPDVAAQVGASMYNNALQNQSQYDTKALEMRQKMQEEQLQRQALKSYLKKAGMSEEEANAASMMPSNTLPAMLGAQQGLVTTYDEQGTPTYTRKIEAPGMSGKPVDTSAKVKMMEMQQKMQDEQLQRQALASFLQQQAGMSPEQAMAASMMPSNTLPSAVNNALGLVQTFDDQGAPTYTRKIEAPGMSGKPVATSAKYSPSQKSAADLNEEQGKELQKAARLAPQQIANLNQLETLVPEIPESGLTSGIATIGKFFGNESDLVTSANKAKKIIKEMAIDSVKKLGVNPSNRDLITLTESMPEIGVDPQTNYDAIARQRAGWRRVQEWNNIYAELQNRPEIQADPTLLPIEFNRAIESLPPLDELIAAERGGGGQAKPAVTNTKPAVGEKKIIKWDDLP